MGVTKFHFTTKSIQYAIYPITGCAAGGIPRGRHLPAQIEALGLDGRDRD
ncbi:hypothetical protein QUB70_03515 [Microcoleus sp. A003_D6]